MQKVVFHKTRYKDGKPLAGQKDKDGKPLDPKGGEEVHERYVMDAIDAHDAVGRFPKHYSFDHPGEDAKIVNRTAATPFSTQMVEVDDGTATAPGAVAVEDSEAPNERARAELASGGFLDPAEREPLAGGRRNKDR